MLKTKELTSPAVFSIPGDFFLKALQKSWEIVAAQVGSVLVQDPEQPGRSESPGKPERSSLIHNYEPGLIKPFRMLYLIEAGA